MKLVLFTVPENWCKKVLIYRLRDQKKVINVRFTLMVPCTTCNVLWLVITSFHSASSNCGLSTVSVFVVGSPMTLNVNTFSFVFSHLQSPFLLSVLLLRLHNSRFSHPFVSLLVRSRRIHGGFWFGSFILTDVVILWNKSTRNESCHTLE
jgi:hypothetical protein